MTAIAARATHHPHCAKDDIEMTSTLSPNDTGDIRLGEGTRDLTYLTQRPVLRRADASGEFPFYQPATIGDVDELARLALGATLVLPVDATPAPPRHAAPTVYLPASSEVKPPSYRGRRRKADPPWAWALVGAGTLLLGQALAAAVFALAVTW